MSLRRASVALTCTLLGCGSDPASTTEGTGDGSSGSDTTVASGEPTETGATTETASVPTSSDGTTTDAPTGGASTGNESTGGVLPTINCAPLPGGAVDVGYMAEVSIEGGAPPYTWSALGLPDGLELYVADPVSGSATITGTPTVVGSSAVSVSVVDADDVEVVAECGELVVAGPAQLDPGKLLANFPEGCISYGVTISDLQEAGVVSGGDGSPPTCSLVPGRGNGSQNFDDDLNTPSEFPPGIFVDPDTCELTGEISSALPFGIYAWITTLELAGTLVHLPYCAAQPVQPATAYEIQREDGGLDATLEPGVLQLGPGGAITYGTATPDPQVFVTDDVKACDGDTCFYSFVYGYDTLSQDSSMVSFNPNKKFPDQGFDGFTHAIRVDDEPLQVLAGRAFVVDILAEYCIADNAIDCGNNAVDLAVRRQKIRENGGGSAYAFSLIVLPEE